MRSSPPLLLAAAAAAASRIASCGALQLRTAPPAPPSPARPRVVGFAARRSRPPPARPAPRRPLAILRMSDDDGPELEPREGKSSGSVKFFDLDDETFADDGENVVGAKFFGGSAVKEELYVPDEEERAWELQNVRVREGGGSLAVGEAVAARDGELEYRRFDDEGAFGDDLGKKVGRALQSAINRILYDDEEGDDGALGWQESSSLTWETPFSKSKGINSPLRELAASKSFYRKLDVAILSANAVKSGGSGGDSVVEVRWDAGAVWPNPWESRVLLTGTSLLNVREDGDEIVLLKQADRLDGKDPDDVVGRLAAQLSPRFWDAYHIGMSPSAELDPRLSAPPSSSSSTSLSKANVGRKPGLLAGYKLSYVPPRLVTEPSLVDVNGRDGRAAQALPNHGFSGAIKTMGPNKEDYVPVSPVEVGIARAEDGEFKGKEKEGGSRITWTVPVPPEVASRAALPLPTAEADDDEADEDGEALAASTGRADAAAKTFESPYARGGENRAPPVPFQNPRCQYRLRESRLVATLPYAGSPQDEEVTQLRRKLYAEAVERDGFTPKLDPKTGRPVFFFWMNDAKACFTRKGGLGMAVYEWRGEWSKSNEVGIELEC
ncbi:hypothetical protein ACHAWF_017223 [Thalassiosira exigua]